MLAVRTRKRAARPIEGAVNGGRAGVEQRADLLRAPAEHVPQNEDRPLPRRKRLQGDHKSQCNCLPLIVARFRVALHGRKPPVREGLDPDRLHDRRAARVTEFGFWEEIGRQSAAGSPGELVQAGVCGDLVQPGPKGGAGLIRAEPFPRLEQRLLNEILRVHHRTQHAIAVNVKLAAIGLGELGECFPVACLGGF